MRIGRTCAFLMLAMAVLWTAMPAFACLLNMHPTGQHACCIEMAPHRDTAGMAADRDCCRAQGQNIALATVPPCAPQHSEKLALIPHEAGLDAPSTLGFQFRSALESPPPRASSGGGFILRI